ncbi:phosphotransferase family protein [Nostoc sp. 3335mG]|nr:phosphotransferase family protein [Nostoc sp. 3335mG]
MIDADAALDTRRLARWLADAGIASGEVRDVRPLVGGTQNLILRLACGGENLVVRRPPPDRAGADRTVRREATVLAALAETDVPHPRFRGFCEDADVMGGSFLVTDEVQGFNATNEMPGAAGTNPQHRREMGFALVDALARLSKVPLSTGGLATLGKPDGFLERQVERWAAQLAGYAETPGWSGDALGPVAEVGAWLQANLPSDYQPGLMHGDYHIANVLYDPAEPRVAAILDWEMAAIGDPLLDLGRLTTVWPNARNEGLLSLKVEPWGGFPDEAAMIDRYAQATGRSMASLPWFQMLACYKFAIVLEGTNVRAAAGKADPAVAARLHASACGLIAKAVQVMAG